MDTKAYTRRYWDSMIPIEKNPLKYRYVPLICMIGQSMVRRRIFATKNEPISSIQIGSTSYEKTTSNTSDQENILSISSDRHVQFLSMYSRQNEM